jgi:hypothetical protein
MANSSTSMTALPTRVDRYPAKMISHLAERLIADYASDATRVLDPFCGSGAVLRAATAKSVPVTGVDINPFGVLLSGVKVEGFDTDRSVKLLEDVLSDSGDAELFLMKWDKRSYWYTPATLRKLEAIRSVASERHLHTSKSGRAVLLSLGLAARLCSRADQRSPKPFISKTARERRGGKHFDPGGIMRDLMSDLCDLYGGRRDVSGEVLSCDIGQCDEIGGISTKCSHVITSPPYINAQDYFRNSKLELYLLEGLLPFSVDDVGSRFIGSERGLNRSVVDGDQAATHRKLVPQLTYLERNRMELAIIVHTYLKRMSTAFKAIKKAMCPGGTFVIVCGDNLIGGKRITTWKVLNEMLVNLGFTLFDSFEDTIRNRALAPTRCGHKGLIKQEVVSAFRLPR